MAATYFRVFITFFLLTVAVVLVSGIDDSERVGTEITRVGEQNTVDPKGPKVELSIDPAYPKGRDYVFHCDAEGFNPESYDWYFGDGEFLRNISERSIFHSYEFTGQYVVTCSASDGKISGTGSLEVLAPPDLMCHSSTRELQISCSNGNFVEDFWNGCRYITCASDEGNFSIKACDKGGGYELWNVTHSGIPGSICAGDKCIEGGVENFVRGEFPLCDVEHTPFISVHRDEVYPLEHNVILECNVDGFSPTSYLWDLGDGTNRTTEEGRIFVIYDNPGRYRVSCIASDGENEREAKTLIDISSPVIEPDPGFPYGVSVLIGEKSPSSYVFRCSSYGFRPQRYEWFVDGDIAGRGVKLHKDFENGTYEITCEATQSLPSIYSLNETHYDPKHSAPFSANESVVLVIGESSQNSSTQLHEGIVAYFPQDGNHHDIVNGHNGKNTSADTFVEGKIGKAFYNLSTRSVFPSRHAPQTISTWVKFDHDSGRNIWHKMDDRQMLERLPDGRVQFRMTEVLRISRQITTWHPVPDGEWHHFVVTLGEDASLYMDGDLVGTAKQQGGGVGIYWPFDWGGKGVTIDEIGMWQKILDEEEVEELYNFHRGNAYSFGSNVSVPSICHDNMYGLNSTCVGGDIVEDYVDRHGCRIVVCTNQIINSSMEISACHKPDRTPPEYFEVYRQTNVSKISEVCIADACVNNESKGFARSGQDFPYCY